MGDASSMFLLKSFSWCIGMYAAYVLFGIEASSQFLSAKILNISLVVDFDVISCLVDIDAVEAVYGAEGFDLD